MNQVVPQPGKPEAERAVIGRIFAHGDKAAAQVVGVLQHEDFSDMANSLIYKKITGHFFEDSPLDAISVGSQVAGPLSALWRCTEDEAIVRCREMSSTSWSGSITDHAEVVRAEARKRRLLSLSKFLVEQVAEGKRGIDEIAALVSERAMRVATDTMLTADITPFGDLGRSFVREMNEVRAAAASGIELGAIFGLPFVDKFTRGLQPTELLICAGEPGVGKSSIWWKAGLKFAERQMRQPENQRIGTLICSLEMGRGPSNMRLAQTITGIDGGLMREGKLTDAHMNRIINEWGRRRDIPLHMNFSSAVRASQLRAIVVEAIRRHNVGLVIVDHFRHFRADRRYDNAVQEDEEKVRFLKESICKDLNVAVICIAHTTKGVASTDDRRPEMTHLRGSYQVAADADFVCFMYRPYKYASEEAKARGEVSDTDAELIFRKNRHGIEGIEPFYFDPETMTIR